MSAIIPEHMLLSDLLKSTGYDCPDDLQGKTFEESTSGGSEVVLEDNKEVSITENGTVEITPSEGKDAMKKVTATVNVTPELDANKEATIDVSTYTEPVEITPTAGKDGMAKATVTLTNIPSPSGGSVTLYCWEGVFNDRYKNIFTSSANPQIGDKALVPMDGSSLYFLLYDIVQSSGTNIEVSYSAGTSVNCTRSASYDVTF